MKKSKSDRCITIIMYLFVILFALCCLLPLLMAFSVSISDEQTVAFHGAKLIPEKISLFTYQYFFANKGMEILTAYGVTLFVVFAGTILSTFVTVAYAYTCSVKEFRFGTILSFFAYFTMLFSGGMLPWYIMCTRYYHLNNTIWGLILPYMMNVFNMYLMRNFIKTIPDEIMESARVDGAGYFTIFCKLILPLAKVGMITIMLFYALAFWNDWYLALMMITKEKLYPVQFLLYSMMQNAEFIASGGIAQQGANIVVPMQTTKMAMTCMAIGPIIFVYPFVQKYFVKGITLGAVKG